jgi:hypothetical protein
MRSIDWKKYILVLLITVAIFATALYVSNRLNDRRIDEIRSIGDQISIDILSSETQFSRYMNMASQIRTKFEPK